MGNYRILFCCYSEVTGLTPKFLKLSKVNTVDAKGRDGKECGVTGEILKAGQFPSALRSQQGWQNRVHRSTTYLVADSIHGHVQTHTCTPKVACTFSTPKQADKFLLRTNI